MAIPLQLRRGTTEQHTTFTGAVGEVTVDTDKDTLIVHDGTTAGGFQVAKTTKTSTDNAIARFDGTTGAIQNSGVVIDDSGNVGIGVTPSAWNSDRNVLQIKYSSLQAYAFGTVYGSNYYYGADTNSYYLTNGYAERYQHNNTNGAHVWYTAPSGTAEDPITWTAAMTLNASGNLGLGVTPSAWTSPAMEFTQNIALSGVLAGVSRNAYFDSASRYKTNGASGLIQIGSNGSMSFLQAPIGTAGNAITWTTALTIPNTGGIQLPNTAIANATTLDWYEEGTATLTATGMTTSPTGTATFTRVGNIVTLTIPSITGISNASTFTLTGVPTNFRPSTSRGMFLMGTDNNINTFINGILAIDGTITLYTQTGTNSWSSSGTKATKTMTVQYHI